MESSDSFDLGSNLETIIDSVYHTLIKINQDKNLKKDDISLEQWLDSSFNLSLLYAELKHFWMQCLWHEWYINSKSQEQIDFITISDFKKGIQHHKSLSWRDEILQAELIQALIDWQNMPIQEKQKFSTLPILKVVQIDSNNNIKLDVSNRHSVEDEFPPEIAAFAITLNNICYQELLQKPCPNFENLTLFEILQYWQFISPLASQLVARTLSSESNSRKNIFLKASPIFQKQDLLQLTLKAFSFTYEQATRIIDLFTFKGEYGDDLWCQPLIKVDDNNFTVIYSCLKNPNLLRCLGTWLKKSGWKQGNLGKKLGHLFENFIIAKLKKSNKLSNFKIYNHPINIGKKNSVCAKPIVESPYFNSRF